MGFGYSEYGRLRTVLMHSPGKELDLITPRTYEKLLFGDAIDPERFRQDHNRLVDVFRSEGVQVALITELLRDQPEDIKETERLPNLIYTRDTATITPKGYILTRMRSPVRRRETKIVEAALKSLSIHPLIRTQPPATIEGGDLIFLDEETLLVGVGHRTNRQAVQLLTKVCGATLLAIPLPSWGLHLDGMLMPVDRDIAIVHPPSLQKPSILFQDGNVRTNVNLPRFLKKRGLNLIEVTNYERQRRATNVMPLGPRKAVAYNGNARVHRELAKNGVDLIEIEGSELIRGSGGPRCLAAVILRE